MDIFDRSIGQEAQIFRSGQRGLSFGLELLARLMEIYLLLAENESMSTELFSTS